MRRKVEGIDFLRTALERKLELTAWALLNPPLFFVFPPKMLNCYTYTIHSFGSCFYFLGFFHQQSQEASYIHGINLCSTLSAFNDQAVKACAMKDGSFL